MAARKKKRPANFTAGFQTALLTALIKDPEILTNHRAQLDPIFWTNEKESEIVEAVLDFFDEQGKPPPLGLLSQILVDSKYWPREDAEEICELMDKVDHTGAKLLVSKFVRRQSIKDTLIRGLEHAERGNIDAAEAEISNILGHNAAVKALKSQYIKTARKRFEAYEANEHEEHIPTGIKSIDRILDGGLARGELGTIIGRAKMGKTTTLINFGKGAMLAGYKVVHITLELSLRKTEQKYDMSLTNVSKGGLFDNTEATSKIYKEKVEELKPDALTVYEFSPDAVTIPSLERTIAYLKPDLIIIDYGDLVVSSRKYEQSRHELTKIWRSLKAMAKNLSAAVWTATQLNRAGADKKTATGKDVAECWEKIAISDIIFTLNQTPEEREKNRMRIFLSEGRDVEDWKTATVYIDRSRALMKDLKDDTR